MNNKDFISLLAQRVGYKQDDVRHLSNTLISIMGDALQSGSSIAIDGFGLFEVKKRLERVVVNPTTHQRMLVPPKLVLAFRPTNDTKIKVLNLQTEQKEEADE